MANAVIADMQQERQNRKKVIGIQFSDVVIESISLPDEVEKLIDEQSGIGWISVRQYDSSKCIKLKCSVKK